MATVTAGPGIGFNMASFSAQDLANADVASSTTSQVVVTYGTSQDTFGGAFQLNASGEALSGTLTSITELQSGSQAFQITGLSLDWAQTLDAMGSGDTNQYFSLVLGGSDVVVGSAQADVLNAYGGADTVNGGGGGDTIDGGAGTSYLRGDDGNDKITGGADFDDINGNMGDDTASGGLGGDWVVGGKDNDGLSGDQGDDIVYGNLGNDWCDGGDGKDLVRGGQGDDMVLGQAGDDWLSGDRGNDTVTGGAGADIFHTFGDAGIDRVTDFSLAEGDRVQLDPGTVYSVAQSGADTVINMTGGGQMVLVGVSMASLTGAWIFGA